MSKSVYELLASLEKHIKELGQLSAIGQLTRESDETVFISPDGTEETRAFNRYLPAELRGIPLRDLSNMLAAQHVSANTTAQAALLDARQVLSILLSLQLKYVFSNTNAQLNNVVAMREEADYLNHHNMLAIKASMASLDDVVDKLTQLTDSSVTSFLVPEEL